MEIFNVSAQRTRTATRTKGAVSTVKTRGETLEVIEMMWLRGKDLNLRPLGYEPNELPGCSTPRADASKA